MGKKKRHGNYRNNQYRRIQAIEVAIGKNDWHLVEKFTIAYLEAADEAQQRLDKFKREYAEQISKTQGLTLRDRLLSLRDQARSLRVELSDPRILKALEQIPEGTLCSSSSPASQ